MRISGQLPVAARAGPSGLVDGVVHGGLQLNEERMYRVIQSYGIRG